MRVARDLIFDIGACEGNDTAFYMRKGFRVVAVEANPDLARRVADRFPDAVASGALRVLNRAAYDSAGSALPIWITNDPEHGTVGHNAHQVKRSHRVISIDWQELLEFAGAIPYYCKIDIEGSERRFLTSMLGVPAARAPYVSIEAHTVEPVAMLADLGYSQFKIINQSYMSAAAVPDPPLEGLYVPDTNHIQGSGLFGQELQGKRWLDLQETLGLFDCIQRLKAFPEIHQSWYDCHATFPEALSLLAPRLQPGTLPRLRFRPVIQDGQVGGTAEHAPALAARCFP